MKAAEEQDQAIVQKHFTSALTPVPGVVLPQVKAQGSPATAPTSCWLWTKHLFIDILPLSEKTQGKEVLVWTVNKMEQSKAALCPVPNLHLTWTSRFLIWLFPLAQNFKMRWKLFGYTLEWVYQDCCKCSKNILYREVLFIGQRNATNNPLFC